LLFEAKTDDDRKHAAPFLDEACKAGGARACDLLERAR
jgi:hypothetical protein